MFYKTTATISTDGDGAATVFLGSSIRGFLHEIRYIPGTLDTGADLVFTGESSEVPILTITNAGTARRFWRPRALANVVASGAEETTSTEWIALFEERVKVVVAQGGANRVGTLELIYIDDAGP